MRLLLLSLLIARASAAEFQFRDGATETNEFSNSSLTIHASYGSITIPAASIARVQFGAAGELDALVTTSGCRFHGFVNDPLQKDGTLILKSALAEIALRPVAAGSVAQYVVLWNGDLLAGSFTLTNLPTQSIHSVWFERDNVKVRLQTSAGQERGVEFALSSLSVALESGSLEIPRALLKTLYLLPGTVPPELHRLTRTHDPSGAVPNTAPVGMVWIPPGRVMLGSPLDERGRNSDEGPQTEVAIVRGFWMGKHEVTQREYAAVMGQNPSTFQGDTNRPVEKVSWHDAMEYCARLTEQARTEGTLPGVYVYRLPTEAEWEYACRAGSTAPYSFGADPAERELPEHAWYAANGGWSTHPVGQLKPNAFGLHDMHGNVLEWCLGLWNDAYPGGRVEDYNGPAEGWLRVARGGSWLYGPDFARSANRDDYGPGNRCSDLGFRVVLAPKL